MTTTKTEYVKAQAELRAMLEAHSTLAALQAGLEGRAENIGATYHQALDDAKLALAWAADAYVAVKYRARSQEYFDHKRLSSMLDTLILSGSSTPREITEIREKQLALESTMHPDDLAFLGLRSHAE